MCSKRSLVFVNLASLSSRSLVSGIEHIFIMCYDFGKVGALCAPITVPSGVTKPPFTVPDSDTHRTRHIIADSLNRLRKTESNASRSGKEGRKWTTWTPLATGYVSCARRFA